MAYCLYRGVTIGAQFTPFVYKYLLDPEAEVERIDYERLSPDTAKNLQSSLHADDLTDEKIADELCLVWEVLSIICLRLMQLADKCGAPSPR